MTKWQVRRERTDSVRSGKWTRSLALLCERDVSYWLLDVGLYPARPAEPFARRMPISLPQEASLAAHRLPPTNDPRLHPAYPGRPRGRAGHCPPPPTTARSKPTPRLTQHRLRQLPARGSDSGRPRAGHGRSGDHADPGHPSHPSHTAACPTAALQDLTSAGHSGRGNAQTPDAHTGRRTADTWTLRRPPRTLDTGPVDRQAWTLVARTGHRTPDTGHRTLAEDMDRVTKARPASGPPGPPRRATARWDTQPCSCGRRLQHSAAHAGSAVRPPSSAR
jgi:hypothetical protein